MKKLIQLSLLSAAMLLSSTAFSESIIIRTLSGRSIEINTEGLKTVGDIKKQIFEKEGIDPDHQRLVYAGKQIESDLTELSSLKLEHNTTLHLVLHKKATEKLKYDLRYHASIRNAQDAVQQLGKTNIDNLRKLDDDNFFGETQLYAMQLGSLFHYRLPAEYFVELTTKLSQMGLKEISDDQLADRHFLMDHAKKYLEKYASGLSQDQIMAWKTKPDELSEYLTCSIAFSITLAKMLADEKITRIEDRFFPDNRSDFIDLYNNKQTIKFLNMLDKYETAHGLNQ